MDSAWITPEQAQRLDNETLNIKAIDAYNAWRAAGYPLDGAEGLMMRYAILKAELAARD